VTTVFAVAVRNPLLLRLELSWVAFTSVEWGSWVALLVYAYVREGAKGSSIIVAVQLVPCIVLSPFLSALPDRYRTGRVLFLSYVGMAVAIAVLALAIALGAPLWVVCIVASLGCLAMSVPRPAESALLPAIVRTPDELTAAHVASSWMENASIMIAPALTGLLIGIGGPALALAALAALGFAGAALISPMPGPAPAPAEADAEIPSIVAEVRDGVRSLSRTRRAAACSSPSSHRSTSSSERSTCSTSRSPSASSGWASPAPATSTPRTASAGSSAAW
jgi:MFS family permease